MVTSKTISSTQVSLARLSSDSMGTKRINLCLFCTSSLSIYTIYIRIIFMFVEMESNVAFYDVIDLINSLFCSVFFCLDQGKDFSHLQNNGKESF